MTAGGMPGEDDPRTPETPGGTPQSGPPGVPPSRGEGENPPPGIGAAPAGPSGRAAAPIGPSGPVAASVGQTGTRGVDRSARPPRATATFMVLIGAVYLLQFIPPLDLLARFGFMPALAAEQPWRTLTHAFIHSQPSPLHVGFNLFALYFFGSFLERAIGGVRFAVVYVLGAIGGAVCVLALADPTDPTSWFALHVGASGAVFALVGVLLTPTRALDRNIGGVVVLVALNAAIPLLEPGISWESHLGGLVTGFVLGCAALLPPPRLRPAVFGAGAVAVLVALAAIYCATILAAMSYPQVLSTL